MSSPQRAPRAQTPRTRSAFAAAFLSLIFPGLGHAYAGAWARALAFAALPLLLIALAGGIFLRVDRFDLLGFVVQPQVLTGIFVVNILILIYRIVAAVDAWNVARFLNEVDASGGGRLGRSKLPLSPLSIAGLLAVLIVIGGAHIAVARYDMLASTLVGCVFSDSEEAQCQAPADSPDPGEAIAGSEAPGPTDTPTQSDAPLATPVGSAQGTLEPELPTWDGKGRLNILLVGVDQRQGDAFFNTDTLIVASIDPVTKEVAMFQVPRDTVDVPVPPNARNVWGSTYSGKINSWYAFNRNRTDLWRGDTTRERGFNALKALLGELYGLDIRYYVMVNFQGFKDAVNTLGGVQINVQIPVAESDYPVAGGVTRIYIPAGPQHMSGGDALIYARSRHRALGGDFDRGRRQQRVLLSLREQMNITSVLDNLQGLFTTLQQSVRTDIPFSQIPKLLSLAQQRRHQEHPLVRVLAVVLRVGVDRSEARLHHPAQRGPDPQGGEGGVLDAAGAARAARAARGRGRAGVGPQRRRPAGPLGQHRRTGSRTTASTPRRPTRRRPRPARRRSSSTTGRTPRCPRRSSTSRTCSTRRSRPRPIPRSRST